METVHEWRKALGEAEDEVRSAHAAGAAGLDLVRHRSKAVDSVVRQVFRTVVPRSLRGSLALVAVGGYGRRQLAPGSDVDLLLYHGPDRGIEPVLGRIERLLWDCGLRLSSTCRNRGDLRPGMADLATATSYIDARLVAGHAPLMAEFTTACLEFRRADGRLLAGRLIDYLARNSVGALRDLSVLEPNLKESPFLLRDVQRVFWISWLLAAEPSLAGFGHARLLSPAAVTALLAACDFLLRVRVGLHFVAGRAEEVLREARLPALARQLGYVGDATHKGEELFLRRFYLQARQVYLATCQVVETRESDSRFLLPGRRSARRWQVSPNLVRIENSLHLSGPAAVCWGQPPAPELLLEPFAVLARTGLHLPFALLNALRQAVSTLSPAGPAALLRAGELLRSILQMHRPVGELLAYLHLCDLLGHLVPEFGVLTCSARFDLYHQFTVDAHSLLAVAELDQFTGGRAGREIERYRVLFDAVPDLAVLRFAVLLHDCARTLGPDHAARGAPLAAAAAARLGFSPPACADIEFLVRHHLLLSAASQHRDIEAAELIDQVAATVQTRVRLNLLFLTTFADMRCVRDGLWTGWKAEQLWLLYHLTAAALERSGEGQTAFAQELALYRAPVGSTLTPAELERHVALMSWPEYARQTPFQRIVEHLRLAQTHRAGGVELTAAPIPHATRLTVVADDAAGLFSRLAGALLGTGLDVVKGSCFTRRDGIAIDEFEVHNSHTGRELTGPDVARVRDALTAVLAGRSATHELLARRRRTFPDRPAPPGVEVRVTVDDRISQHYTVVEVHTADRTGLLHDLGVVLERLRLNLRFVKISTHARQAVDTFYVVDRHGEKLDEAARTQLLRALTPVLGAALPSAGPAVWT